ARSLIQAKIGMSGMDAIRSDRQSRAGDAQSGHLNQVSEQLDSLVRQLQGQQEVSDAQFKDSFRQVYEGMTAYYYSQAQRIIEGPAVDRGVSTESPDRQPRSLIQQETESSVQSQESQSRQQQGLSSSERQQRSSAETRSQVQIHENESSAAADRQDRS